MRIDISPSIYFFLYIYWFNKKKYIHTHPKVTYVTLKKKDLDYRKLYIILYLKKEKKCF